MLYILVVGVRSGGMVKSDGEIHVSVSWLEGGARIRLSDLHLFVQQPGFIMGAKCGELLIIIMRLCYM